MNSNSNNGSKKSVTFLGIKFRGMSHKLWFLVSVTATIVTWTTAMTSKDVIVPLATTLVAGANCLMAIMVTRSGRKSVAYSRDCIWWNAVVFLANFPAIVVILYSLLRPS